MIQRSASRFSNHRAGLPRKKMRRARVVRVTLISRAASRQIISLFFSARGPEPLARKTKLDHKRAPSLGLVSGLLSRQARAALRFRVPLIEGEAVAQWQSAGTYPEVAGSIPVGFNEDSSDR